MTHNPIHLEVLINPIFVNIDGIEFPFEGFTPKDDDDDKTNTEFTFIKDTLHHYLGNIVFNNFNEEIIKGMIEIEFLSHDQKKILERIYEYTGTYFIKYGPSYLKFIIICGESSCDCKFCYKDNEDVYSNWKNTNDNYDDGMY